MNNTTLPILSFLAALAAILVLPVSAPTSCIALTFTGVLAILASDYGREIRPIQARANVIPADFSARKAVQLGRAA
jgi:hypothetical protein